MATALDYSQGRPSAAAVKAAGHSGVIRYIGTPGRTKNITRAEYADMTSKGISVALVYENRTGDAGGGYGAGVTAARNARADADSVGFPSSRPIYFAVDSDQVTAADFAAVSAYLDGAASVLGSLFRVGVYGEYEVIERNVGSHASYGWQTAAWSLGERSAKAHIYQRLGQVYVGGIQSDVNDILASDWGQHDATEEYVPTAKEIVDELMSREVDLGNPPAIKLVAFSEAVRWTNVDTATISAAVKKLTADVTDLKTKVATPVDLDALAAKLAPLVQPVDYAALAKAVNDDAARRLEG